MVLFLAHNIILSSRFVYPEFLPNPRPDWRNRVREKLERQDMLARRAVMPIPEFYVGESLLQVCVCGQCTCLVIADKSRAKFVCHLCTVKL